MLRSLVGSEMCIRDRTETAPAEEDPGLVILEQLRRVVGSDSGLAKFEEMLADFNNGMLRATDFWSYMKDALGRHMAVQLHLNVAQLVPDDEKRDRLEKLAAETRSQGSCTRMSTWRAADDADSVRLSMDHSRRQLPPNIFMDQPVRHLILCVHGIGAHDGFGNERLQNGNFHKIRNKCSKLISTHFDAEVSFEVEWAAVEWHSQLHGEVDQVFDTIAPQSVLSARALIRNNLMDVLFFMSGKHGQLILENVCQQLNQKYQTLIQRHPGYDGKVSILGHSLGSVIAYMLLSGMEAPGNAEPPKLDFEVDHFFACGSPIALFLLALHGQGTDMSAPLPRCAHFFNIVHPLDPVSYRMEPLLGGAYSSVPGILPDHIGLKNGGVAQILTAVSDCSSGRVDVELKPKIRHELAGTLAARFTHSAYWGSSDMMLFILARVCEPIASKVRHYSPRKLPVIHKPLCPMVLNKDVVHSGIVLCRLSLAGSWFSGHAILLSDGMLHLLKDSHPPPRVQLEASLSLSVDCALNVLPAERSFQIVSSTPTGRKSHTFKASSVREFDCWLKACGQGCQHQDPEPGPQSRSDATAGGPWFGAIRTGTLNWSCDNDHGEEVWCAMHRGSLDVYLHPPCYPDSIQINLADCNLECGSAGLIRLARSGGSVEWRVVDTEDFNSWAAALHTFSGTRIDQQQDLGDSSGTMVVKVEGHRIQSDPNGEPFAAFVLCVTWESSLHVLLRRFSEFEALLTALRGCGSKMSFEALPSTRLFRRLEPAYLSQKEASLELWCNRLAAAVHKGQTMGHQQEPVLDILRSFFCPSDTNAVFAAYTPGA
eukprot:TRINITY_DN21049_c0_g1_i2.p1 TRINITY_DN21049_c0_g1~~TRINITY_DN21049_c0_g1_i2.p1  ORF type:complete len:859 (-),score=194.39 TRINITY_DN21049_c0_g1_i2:32-2500(-)